MSRNFDFKKRKEKKNNFNLYEVQVQVGKHLGRWLGAGKQLYGGGLVSSVWKSGVFNWNNVHAQSGE